MTEHSPYTNKLIEYMKKQQGEPLDFSDRITYENHMCDLDSKLSAMTARAERAEAVVEKLPKTADGVRVVPHMDYIYHPSKPAWSLQAYGDKEQSALDVCRPAEDGSMKGIVVPVSECYFTREAAQAAIDAKGGGGGGMNNEATDIRTIQEIIDDAAREAATQDNRAILDDIQHFILQGVSIHDITVLAGGWMIEGRRAVPKSVFEAVNKKHMETQI